MVNYFKYLFKPKTTEFNTGVVIYKKIKLKMLYNTKILLLGDFYRVSHPKKIQLLNIKILLDILSAEW